VLELHQRQRTAAAANGREELIDLPLMTNSKVLDILEVLTEVVTPALFFDENLSSQPNDEFTAVPVRLSETHTSR
jgi:hypothetical protein